MSTQVPPPDSPDITSCDSEPIRIPGSIQPHGVLFVLGQDGATVTQLSANAGSLLRLAPEEAAGKALREVLKPQVAAALPDVCAVPAEQGLMRLGTVADDDRVYHVIASRSQQLTLIEFEDGDAKDSASLDSLYPQIRSFLNELEATASEQAANEAAAAQVRRLTGFDRVLVYKFDGSWNGTVVAENRNERLPSYLDLRFPASDIPAQARELYRSSRLRLIPDASYTPVPIIPAVNPETLQPVDLGFSTLRSVSPVHLEYMRNMGTPASMSISILIGGQLWGLISCHNASPKRVPEHVRSACDLIGQVLAMQIAARQREGDALQTIARQTVQTQLLAAMAAEENFLDGLMRHPAQLLALTNADGAAVLLDGQCVTTGRTPPVARIRDIAQWIMSTQAEDQPFVTSSLATMFPGAEDLAETASGVLAVPVSQVHASSVMWFRKEVVETVKWGGNPRKTAQPGERLHPRRSFDIWKETVRLQSIPWSSVDTGTAQSFRGAIISIVLRKAEELAQLADDLRRSNKELEAFSYSISHDLRAPFRHIVGYAELLKDSEALQRDERSRRYVATIIESALSAGKLVDDLLGFSRIGRTALVRCSVDMNLLVDETRNALWHETRGRQIEWRISKLDAGWGDPSLLRQVWMNLLSNAIKYTRPRDAAIITVSSERTSGETVYCVTDNGVGFEMDYVGKLFGVFQRLHRMEEFEGTGIGLANVRRIVERHGGRSWAEGSPGAGARLFFSLPDQQRMNDV